MMKRRDALKTIGGLGAAAGMARFLPSCGGGDDGPVGITTYVYMMMENRSYDHFFGARSMLEGKPGDGLLATMSNPDLNGQLVSPWQADVNTLCDIDPPHGWDPGRVQLNGGANDGFLIAHQTRYSDRPDNTMLIEPMQYLTRTHVPVSWALADHYATADRWFSAVLGPTWPNRFYWHGATSEGIITDELANGLLTEPTIYNRLDAKGVDWAYYHGFVPFITFYQGVDVSRIRRFSDFLADAAAGTLPPVVYIDPAFGQNDDHPPIHPIHGQELIAAVYTALARSPQWKNCMLVITYDEPGGFFDHVPPPKTVDARAADGFDQLGFRVPTLVAGPYVKQGHVSSVVHEHCSALRELEIAFDLEPLNARTMASSDLSDFIDAERLAKGDWAPPIELPAVDVTQWPMGPVCTSGGGVLASQPIIEWADTNPAVLAGLDLRQELPEYRRTIRDFLATRSTARVK